MSFPSVQRGPRLQDLSEDSAGSALSCKRDCAHLGNAFCETWSGVPLPSARACSPSRHFSSPSSVICVPPSPFKTAPGLASAQTIQALFLLFARLPPVSSSSSLLFNSSTGGVRGKEKDKNSSLSQSICFLSTALLKGRRGSYWPR